MAATEEEARARVVGLQRELEGTKGELLRVLGTCCSCSDSSSTDIKGKGRATPLSIHLSFTSLPTFCPSHPSSATLITFVPPSRSHLQFLSLVPLQLDLNSFSSPSKGGQRAPDEDQLEGAGVLGKKVQKSAKLDFSSPVCVDMANLEQVVDWVRSASARPTKANAEYHLDQPLLPPSSTTVASPVVLAALTTPLPPSPPPPLSSQAPNPPSTRPRTGRAPGQQLGDSSSRWHSIKRPFGDW